MNRSLLAAVALSALIVAPAMAADLGVRPPPPVYQPPPPVVPIFAWTGCYVGGHAGGLWAKKDWTDVTNPAFPSFGHLVASHDVNGWLGGVQAGCDYQFAGGWVIGIQADYAWTDADGSSIHLLDPTISTRSNIESLGSGTIRLGYAWGQFLGYVKGGAAWEWDSHEFISNVTGLTFEVSGRRRRIGWTVGVGGEYAFTNWVSAFVEYNYYDFGTKTIAFTFNEFFDIDETKSVVKAGLNFRFGGWGKYPVAARY